MSLIKLIQEGNYLSITYTDGSRVSMALTQVRNVHQSGTNVIIEPVSGSTIDLFYADVEYPVKPGYAYSSCNALFNYILGVLGLPLVPATQGPVTVEVKKEGYGDVTPGVGCYQYETGQLMSLEATPRDDSYFENFDINGSLITESSHSFVPTNPTDIQANFKLWNNDNILFNSVPVDRNGTFLFENTGLGADSEVKNIKVGQTGASGAFVNSGVYLQGQSEVDLEFEVIFNSVVNQMLFTTISAGLNKGLGLYSSGTGLWYLTSGDGTSQVTILNFTLYNIGYHKIRIQWNGLTGGLLTLTVTDKDAVRTYSVVNNYSWVGNSNQTLRMGHNTSILNARLLRMYAKGYFEWIFNHGQGATIYDISGNGNNGTVTGANLATFWGSTANNIEPYDLTKGATLYEADVVYLSGELITNGSFDNSGAGWIPTAQCSVNLGYGRIYTADGSSQTISQNMTGFIALNKHFLLEFDIIENIIGGLTIQFNGSTYTNTASGVGHKKLYLTSTYSGAIALVFNRFSGTGGVQDIKIDNVSLRETLTPYIADDGSIMPICFNTSQAITGYTRLGYFAPNSGILKGLPNTYNVNGVDRDFTYLKALATSETRIKTETDNNISYFKERSKDV